MRTEPQETESMSGMLTMCDDALGTDEDTVEITVVVSTASGELILCGMDDGSIVPYKIEERDGREITSSVQACGRKAGSPKWLSVLG